jgi:hypothetical protein
MPYRAAAFALLVAVLPALPAGAAPSPLPRGLLIHRVPTTLSHPGKAKTIPPMSGLGCIGPHANAAQTAVNPITGKAQAAPLVVVPLTGGSSVAAATTRAQQAHACAHPRT